MRQCNFVLVLCVIAMAATLVGTSLGGCMASVTAEQWAAAEDMCENNGGAHFLEQSYAHCYDGARFQR